MSTANQCVVQAPDNRLVASVEYQSTKIISTIRPIFSTATVTAHLFLPSHFNLFSEIISEFNRYVLHHNRLKAFLTLGFARFKISGVGGVALGLPMICQILKNPVSGSC